MSHKGLAYPAAVRLFERLDRLYEMVHSSPREDEAFVLTADSMRAAGPDLDVDAAGNLVGAADESCQPFGHARSHDLRARLATVL